MPDQSQVAPASFICEGGLVLNRSTFQMEPGQALDLENFEPDIEGGYRRINGFRKYVNVIVPNTSSSSENVIGLANFNNVVIACRGEKIWYAASTELAISIARTDTMSGSGVIKVDSVAGFATSGTLTLVGATTEDGSTGVTETFNYTGINLAVTPNEFTGVTRSGNSQSTLGKHLANITVSSEWKK